MRVISRLLYWLGIFLILAGIWFLQYNLPLGINMMPIGLVVMFAGWVLDAYEVGYGNDM